jgi:hypothetical protein
VLRLSGVPERKESPLVLHDVIKAGDKTYLFPLVIGLPNRHNILFDLETNRLAAWWLGDTARQRTKGKSWYWEAGADPVVDLALGESELTLVVDDKEIPARTFKQFSSATLDRYDYSSNGVGWSYRLTFDAPLAGLKEVVPLEVQVSQSIAPVSGREGESEENGFSRTITINGVPPSIRARVRVLNGTANSTFDDESGTWQIRTQGGDIVASIKGDPAVVHRDGYVELVGPPVRRPGRPPLPLRFVVDYRTALPADRFDSEPPPVTTTDRTEVQIAPGFTATRLPLPVDIMPSGLAWEFEGDLVFTSLKGQVIRVGDHDGDDLEESYSVLVDGLPTPYGLSAEFGINVVTKTGFLSVEPADGDSTSTRVQVLASGWGVTDDYHDWAVGLAAGSADSVYLALPCQQDARSPMAASHRGQVLQLVPVARKPIRPGESRRPRDYKLEVVSSGHRFPMGLARNRDGELFVTDNQGNYNPFNELNHVRPGAHFGFINALEKDKGFKPPRLDKPAIDIPHPWTRSVNGICFLDTPVGWKSGRVGSAHQQNGDEVGTAHPTLFGPLEGHLVGCEYDTRQLIRMTLQKVGDTFQGAAYPLSIPPENVEDGLLGPIVCAVSPRGELYVGNIRDSGWGAGNNVGDIVRIKIEPDKLPCGIAEVRATKEGFTLDFFRPVDPAKARDAANYSIASYRRESTSAYGGPNLDRRSEKIVAIELSPDSKRVTLKLSNLRPGFLYEFQLKPLVRGKELFHPAEAHYTLNQIP